MRADARNAMTACLLMARLRHADRRDQCPLRWKTGKHLLWLSISHFDPKADL
jgi:hypothetical protein